jgi:hypothetical protein
VKWLFACQMAMPISSPTSPHSARNLLPGCFQRQMSASGRTVVASSSSVKRSVPKIILPSVDLPARSSDDEFQKIWQSVILMKSS